MVVAMIPTAMPVPVMAGMQPVSVGSPPQQPAHVAGLSETPPAASAPGPFASPSSGSQSSDETPLPAGGKPERRLEDLLPRGRRPTSTRENLGRKVFVGGLNPVTTTEDLREYFSSFGEVADSCVITDAITKESRGFGFVVFEEKIPEGLLDKQHIIDQRRCGVREYSQSTSS